MQDDATKLSTSATDATPGLRMELATRNVDGLRGLAKVKELRAFPCEQFRVICVVTVAHP